MRQAKILRKHLQKKKLLVVSGVYDALTARIARYCRFPVIYMTGYGTAASYGYPDFGLLTMSEMLDNVRRISDAVDLPLIADADTGYGNPLNVYRTVQEYERAGAAGIQLEDQTWPKRCGHMGGKKVIRAEEMVAKIKAAVDARICQETVLVIRTDAIATHGLEEAIRRGRMYAEAGADVLFIEAPSPRQMKTIPSRFSKPCLLNMPFPNREITLKAIEKMGYRIALYPIITLLGAISGSIRMCKLLIGEGKFQRPVDLPFDFEELHSFLGLDKFKKLEQKFA